MQISSSLRTETNPIKINNSKSSLPTPVSVKVLEQYLQGYDTLKSNKLLLGFSEGFLLQYTGPRQFRDAKNLKSADDNKSTLKEKIEKEVSLGRIAGPFDHIPMPNIHISPLGLVPKKRKK